MFYEGASTYAKKILGGFEKWRKGKVTWEL
jgi:hypothetical protein